MSITPPISAQSHSSSAVANGPVQLRDWFAGEAMAAMIIAPKQPGVSRLEMDGMAKAAYEYADAMLKAR